MVGDPVPAHSMKSEWSPTSKLAAKGDAAGRSVWAAVDVEPFADGKAVADAAVGTPSDRDGDAEEHAARATINVPATAVRIILSL
jgi:hypothetical protein